MKFVNMSLLLAFVACCFSKGVIAQQGKSRVTKEQLDRFLANREEKQRVKEAYRQAQKVRGLVSRLSQLLTDLDQEVRYDAARGLAEIGPSAAPTVGTLASRLYDESPRVRAAVATALYAIGPSAKEAVPDLVIVLGDSDAQVRRNVAVALGEIRSRGELVVPALIKALDDPDRGHGGSTVRGLAIAALGKFGTEAKGAYPRLLKDFKEGKNRAETCALLDTLAATKGNPGELVGVLIESINDPAKEDLYACAASTLGRIGPEAKSAVPHLLKLFERKDFRQPKTAAEIQPRILHALGAMGSAAREAVPAIIGYAADPILAHTNVRNAALIVLGDLGPTAKEAIPFLIDCLQRKGWGGYHWQIGRGLSRIGKEAVKPLIQAYLAAPEIQRGGIIRALGMMGKDATEALPLLEAERMRPPPSHRALAVLAIRGITGKQPR